MTRIWRAARLRPIGPILMAVLFVSACAAPLKVSPLSDSREETGAPRVAQTNVASDTQLFLKGRQFLVQTGQQNMNILVMGGRIMVFGAASSSASAETSRRSLLSFSKAKDVFWYTRPALPEKTPAQAQALFEQRSAILGALETRWSQDPDINALNLRAGVDDDLTLYVLGFVTSDKEQAAVLDSLSYSRGISDVVHRISLEKPRS